MIVNRTWAMPNSLTFSIKPIKEFVQRYIDGKKIIIDPFANDCKYGTITNDLNPKFNTDYHLDALDFLKQLHDNSADCVLYDPPYCYDPKTEILTKNGFKFIKDISYSDLIATLNTTTNILEYQNPTDIIAKPYQGKMVEIDSQSINMLVTPNHRCWVKKSFYGDYHWTFAKDLFKETKNQWFKKDCDWNGQETEFFMLPSVDLIKPNRYGEKTKPVKSIRMDLWLKFLGLYLSEGSYKVNYCINGKHRYTISIAQKNEFGRQKIIEMLDELGYKYCISKNDFRIDDKQLWTYVKQFGHSLEKHIPEEFKNLSKRQLNILIEYLMIGDGRHIKYNKLNKNANKIYTYETNSYSTASVQLMNDFVEIAIKSGKGVSVNTIQKNHYNLIYSIHMLGAKSFRVNEKDCCKDLDYNGFVYCVSVPNSTLLVKRQGRIFWCGNSLRQVKECYEGVGIKVTSEHTKSSWRAKHLDEIKRILKPNGVALCFGWNSNGVGKTRDFEMMEILLVAHGGSKNDTICTAEIKRN